MTRRLVAFLFGGVAAAQVHESRVVIMPQPDCGKECPPVNNKCPVCGTMAEAFRPVPDGSCRQYAMYDLKTGEPVNLCDQPLPTENLVRCKKCNNAFWQSAEAAHD